MKEEYFEIVVSSCFRILPEEVIEFGNRLVQGSNERVVAITERKGSLVFIIGPREDLSKNTSK